ncbi:hypothetical protein BJ165DRAFT_1488479 [Panaeolus papilionaceus]|nr:hypothetical protein BJ165DRAFT_1488479 [Panaeolus papilionaceus]
MLLGDAPFQSSITTTLTKKIFLQMRATNLSHHKAYWAITSLLHTHGRTRISPPRLDKFLVF